MKRAIFIVSALLIGFIVSATTFLLFNNHERVLSYDDFIYDEISIEESTFYGRFQVVDLKYRICDYDYKIENGTLFLSIKGTAGDKKVLDVDDDGYVTLKFELDEEIERIVYRVGDKENEIDRFK